MGETVGCGGYDGFNAVEARFIRPCHEPGSVLRSGIEGNIVGIRHPLVAFFLHEVVMQLHLVLVSFDEIVEARYDLSAEDRFHLRKFVEGRLVGRREHSGRCLRGGMYARGFRAGHVEPRAVGIVPVVARDIERHALGVGDVRDVVDIGYYARGAPHLLRGHGSGLLGRSCGDGRRDVAVFPCGGLLVVCVLVRRDGHGIRILRVGEAVQRGVYVVELPERRRAHYSGLSGGCRGDGD